MLFISTLAHYFYPGYSNNHKAKLLHSSTLFFLALLLIAFQVVINAVPTVGLKVLGYAANIPPDQIITLTNQKRTQAGLPALQSNTALSQAAKAKGEHMLALDYWAHVAPDGTEPWSFFISSGYKYRYAGENLARDFSDPNSAVEAWMASPSHKDNMLSSRYKDIGVAVVEGDLGGVDTTIIVQLFGASLADSSSQVPVAQAQPQTTASPTVVPAVTTQPTNTPVPTQAAAPVALVSPLPTNPPTEELLTGQPATGKATEFQLLISPFDTTRTVSLATIVILLSVMVIDGIVTSKKRIPRIGGRIFAHLAFLGMIMALILIAKAGEIL